MTLSTTAALIVLSQSSLHGGRALEMEYQAGRESMKKPKHSKCIMSALHLFVDDIKRI